MTLDEKREQCIQEYLNAKTDEERFAASYKYAMAEPDDAPLMWGIVDLSKVEIIEDK
jgi:hypothetical protein